MVSITGLGFFRDFVVIHRWAGLIWQGQYSGQYPYPLMVVLAPIALAPVDVAAVVCVLLMLLGLVISLRRESLYWIFFVPVLQTIFLGQLDLFFWLVYRSKRPAVWALLSLKPQFLLPALPRIFASKRNLGEFLAASAALHLPFLLIRPSWPSEWIHFLLGYGENRLTRVPSSTTSAPIIFSAWIVPFAAALIVLFVLRKKNLEHLLFLANPALLPYDYSLLTGDVNWVLIPLSWLALWASGQVRGGWPYAVVLLAVVALETIKEKRHRGNVPAQLSQ